jgi:hypothetical protein
MPKIQPTLQQIMAFNIQHASEALGKPFEAACSADSGSHTSEESK